MLKELTAEALTGLLSRALTDRRGFGAMDIHMKPELLSTIAAFANGDARTALNTLEMAVLNGEIHSDGSITVKKKHWSSVSAKKLCCMIKRGRSTTT